MMKKVILKLKEDFWAYTLLFVGFILRLLYIFNFTKPENYLWSDAGGYDQRALQMAKDQYIMFSTYFPPFFHMFLSLIYRPVIWLGLESWRIKIDVVFFALLYILSFWCIYQISKKLFSKKTALIILTILILWYPFIFLNALVMSENLFFPLFFFGLYLLITKPDKTSTGFWIGLCWGFAVVTRPIFALALPLFLLWGLYYKINWKFLLNFIITAGLIIVAIMIFNFCYTQGSEKSISSNGGSVFALLWCDAKSIQFTDNGVYYWFAPPANSNYPDSRRIFTSVPFTNQKYYYQMGFDCLKQNPERLITNISSVAKLFYSQLFPTIESLAGWEILQKLFRFLTGLLFIISTATIIGISCKFISINKSVRKYFYLFALIILSLIITTYFQGVGEERYIIPYVPLLIISSVPIFKNLSSKKETSSI